MPDPRAPRLGGGVALSAPFVDAARRYWITVFPHVRRELSRLRERAEEIPDPALRRLAFDAQRKRGNLEGAAAFAAFVPRPHRAAVVRAVLAFQAAYDYLDVLAEQPQVDPVAGARGLHEALLDSLDPALGTEGWVGTESLGTGSLATPGLDRTTPLDPAGGQPDYYARYPRRDDNGYLAELVEECRTALATLPSYPSVATAAQRAAERIAKFQSLNLSESQGDHDALARWARTETSPAMELEWWEAAAAGGSPLCVYALIAAAADPAVHPAEVEAIENAYFPSIGALHSLLDHLVDRARDAASGERNLLDYYASPLQAAVRMQALAERAVCAARALPRGRRHAIVLAGMAGYYLSHSESSAPDARPIARNVRGEIGGLLAPTLLVFKARRLAGRLAAIPRDGTWKNARRGLLPLARP